VQAEKTYEALTEFIGQESAGLGELARLPQVNIESSKP